jgi:hypothetical protein
MEEVPHSQFIDEQRLTKLINSLISDGKLETTPTWKKTSTDEKARSKREKAAAKSAKEAEAHAKELGVWEEFYGNGKKGKRKSDARDEADPEAGLAALILKRQKEREGGLDRLAEKYKKLEEEERAKKKGKKGKGKKDQDEEEIGGHPVSEIPNVTLTLVLTMIGNQRCRLCCPAGEAVWEQGKSQSGQGLRGNRVFHSYKRGRLHVSRSKSML